MPGIDWLNAFIARRKTIENIVNEMENRITLSEREKLELDLHKDKIKGLNLGIQILEYNARTYSRLEKQFFEKLLKPWYDKPEDF